MDRTAAPNSRQVQSFLYIIELTLNGANAILIFGQKKVKSFGRLAAEAVVFGYTWQTFLEFNGTRAVTFQVFTGFST